MMTSGMICVSRDCSYLYTKPYPPTRKRMPQLQACPGFLLETHFTKPSISVTTPSGSNRSRAKARAATNDLWETSGAGGSSLYELLGVPRSGTPSQIKRAYKQLALKYHPDVSPPDRMEEYTQRFIRLRDAYQTLSDPETKASYDMQLTFSTTRPSQHDQRNEWRKQWESQLMELSRRSQSEDSRGHTPWGARMRRRKASHFSSWP